ncbi:MAG: hypothetical protein JW741_07230 [Sedimentisphaerales bacterium]|nr:hypothetical protein [Sedimentisphaerales bacterium]
MEQRERIGSGEPSGASPGGFCRRRWWIGLLCLALVLVGAIFLWLRRGLSADEELRAIDAAHAIAKEENAATVYNRLILDDTLPPLNAQLLPASVRAPTLSRPWRSADFPQAAEWLKQRGQVVDALLQAGRKQRCWFLAVEAPQHSGKRFERIYHGALLLIRSANNDWAEGRVEQGLNKLLCVFQMARHFRSQAYPSDYDAGEAVASEGLKRFAALVVNEDVPADWLARFEAVLPPTEDGWDERSRLLHKIERLYIESMNRGPFVRVLHALDWTRREYTKRSYFSLLAESRAVRILLELRRNKNETGAWPANLAYIENRVAPEALVDPVTGKPLVYRPTGDVFTLYSTGPNGRDEGGQAGDDHCFWPR